MQQQTEQNEAETTVQQKSVMAGSSRTTHKAHIITNWLCECDDELAVLVTRSQSKRVPLGCGGSGDLHHGSAAPL